MLFVRLKLDRKSNGVDSIFLLIREAWIQMSAWTSTLLIEDLGFPSFRPGLYISSIATAALFHILCVCCREITLSVDVI